MFSIFFFSCRKKFLLVFFSDISFKCVLLLALVSEFNCFLRSRCSMEMWCPDDIGRDSWDWVGPPAWERAWFNSPEWSGSSSPVKTEPLQIVLLLLLLLFLTRTFRQSVFVNKRWGLTGSPGAESPGSETPCNSSTPGALEPTAARTPLTKNSKSKKNRKIKERKKKKKRPPYLPETAQKIELFIRNVKRNRSAIEDKNEKEKKKNGKKKEDTKN